MFLALLLAAAAHAGIRPRQDRELRGVWIASVANMDWPSKAGLTPAEQQREISALFDVVQKTNMNAVFVQVRPCADTFYPSKLAPWSHYLSGTQGTDPGYDPLAYMIAEAHRRNLQFHAWFNPYRVSGQDSFAQLSPNNIARQHPEWVIKYGGKLYFNPGLPAVREHLVAVIMEVVKGYEVDGIHFDDYFYPYPIANTPFPDQAAFQAHGAGFTNVADWRRDNVNRLISELALRIRAVNPAVQFGISPFGVWRNKADDPTGSDTRAGVTCYDSLYADTRLWIKRGWVDYIAPQIYWSIGFAAAAYEKLVPWWSNEVVGTNVNVFIGHAAYRVNDGFNAEELPKQLTFNRKHEAVKGSIYFRMKTFVQNPLGFRDRLVRDFYKEPVPAPVNPASFER